MTQEAWDIIRHDIGLVCLVVFSCSGFKMPQLRMCMYPVYILVHLLLFSMSSLFRAQTIFNMKISSYQYRKSHCGDKTILGPSYLHTGISYTGKTTSLYWIRPLIPFMFLAATKQLYDWFSPSVCPSVCLSVCPSVTPFSPCSHHRIIMKFSGVITMVRSDVHAKGQGQRSKVKVTEVNTQLSRFRTLTPVWIHI